MAKMHADEIESSVELVARLIAAQFPEWSDLPIRRVLSAGTENALYRIGDALVARLPLTPPSDTRIAMQRTWLSKLAPHLPVAISQTIAWGTPTAEFPWPWQVCRWLRGHNPMIGRDSFHDALTDDLADFVAALQRIDASNGPPSSRGVSLVTRDEPMRNAIAELGPSIDRDRITAIWEACVAAPEWPGAPVCVHGDLLPGNVLVERDRLCAVIDFGMAGVGDPACDSLAAWSLFSAHGRARFREMLAIDDATWLRGIGWALSVAVIIVPYYRVTNPVLAKVAECIIEQIIGDVV